MLNKIGNSSPYFLNKLLVKIPFEYRYGAVYSEFQKKIKESETWNEEMIESYIIKNFNNIFQFAKKFDLYKSKYEKYGVLDLVVTSLDDIKKIPILTRAEIRESFTEFNGKYCGETGGTSGNPLKLYLDKDVWAREWSHFHYIWGKAEYKYTDAKFSFRKQNKKDKFIEFELKHNDYKVNTYKMTDLHIEEFFKILSIRDVKYFHGYPSAIYDFLKEIEYKISENQKDTLKSQIKCCFFGSEYPTPQIVDYIRNNWNLNFISWYGHSEKCVLAASHINELIYYPLHTYGYVEVENEMLLGTSFHNFDMPLIRYNTDDLVIPKIIDNGVLKSFEIKQGRIFDFIFDRNNLKIAIISMLRERGFEIFKYVDYIQVYQISNGFATLIISQSKSFDINLKSLINLEDIDIEFNFLFLKKPIKTASGKVPLRIHSLPQ